MWTHYNVLNLTTHFPMNPILFDLGKVCPSNLDPKKWDSLQVPNHKVKMWFISLGECFFFFYSQASSPSFGWISLFPLVLGFHLTYFIIFALTLVASPKLKFKQWAYTIISFGHLHYLLFSFCLDTLVEIFWNFQITTIKFI